MDIKERLRESEQKFEQKKAEREQYLATASDCWDEMNKLMGEYRMLNDLLKAEDIKKVNKKANVIEAVPEESK